MTAPTARSSHSHADLEQAFRKVSDPNDWRGPIDAVIDDADRHVVGEAVAYFTATSAEFHPVPGQPGKLRVTAVGYRCGPAGP